MSLKLEWRLKDNLKFEFEVRMTLVTPGTGFTQGIRNYELF